jgi:hypothetical protein
MCRPTRAPPKKKHSLLLTTESFGPSAKIDKKKNDDADDTIVDPLHLAPSIPSTLVTLAFVVGIFVSIEQTLRFVFDAYQHVHPMLSESERNRNILARHIGVDAMACFAVAVVGMRNAHLLDDIKAHTFGRSDSMKPEDYKRRMFTYHPAAQQTLLLFLAYQIKNFYDSWVWNDGVVFLLHHLFSGLTAWGAMYPGGAGHMYGIFYMGISEISTCILCLLANFDDEFGVVGLGDAFPKTKLIMGVMFAVAFVVFRCVIWPICTWHYISDTKKALECDSDLAANRKGWIKLFRYSCMGLSVLQVMWLGEIFMTLKRELEKMSA